MRDTAAEEGGRQRRDPDFPGEYSVEVDLRKRWENMGQTKPTRPPYLAINNVGL